MLFSRNKRWLYFHNTIKYFNFKYNSTIGLSPMGTRVGFVYASTSNRLLLVSNISNSFYLVISYHCTFKSYHYPQEIRTPTSQPLRLRLPLPAWAIVGLNSATSQFTIVQMVNQLVYESLMLMIAFTALS